MTAKQQVPNFFKNGYGKNPINHISNMSKEGKDDDVEVVGSDNDSDGEGDESSEEEVQIKVLPKRSTRGTRYQHPIEQLSLTYVC
jgi:hypothetical protein